MYVYMYVYICICTESLGFRVEPKLNASEWYGYVIAVFSMMITP